VHFQTEGEAAAPSEPLHDNVLATNGLRAPQHPIQSRDPDGCLSLLDGEAACSQPRSDQCLVAAHRRFDLRACAIICRFPPSQSSLLRDHRQMTITLYRWTLFTTGDSSRAWWDHDFDGIAARRDRCVGGCTIIRAVSRYPDDLAVNLIQQWRHLRWIVDVLRQRHGPSTDRAVIRR
jgi:hypothetical protein